MSYILDALKKAQAEQDPAARASLAAAEVGHRRQRMLGVGIVITLSINAVLLAWLLTPSIRNLIAEQSPQPQIAAPAAATAARAAPLPEAAEPAVALAATSVPNRPPDPGPSIPARAAPAPVQRPADPTPESTAGDIRIGPGQEGTFTNGGESTAETRQPATPIALRELPNAAAARFPAMDFSTHLYSDDPELRAIVVNGTRAVEGDYVLGLLLKAVTTNGAVFSFEGRDVLVPVLDDWE